MSPRIAAILDKCLDSNRPFLLLHIGGLLTRAWPDCYLEIHIISELYLTAEIKL